MKHTPMIFVAVLAAALLVALGYFGGRRLASTAPSPTRAAASKADGGGKKVLYWYDTMVPQQHFDHPGLSPMGMKMVPRYSDENLADENAIDDNGVVRIDPATVQNLGVRTAVVQRRVLGAAIRVPATIGWDRRQAVTISARVDAVVSQLDVRAPYTKVSAGQPLAELLAPKWRSAVAEYHALQQAQSADAQALRGAARQRLRVLGMTAADIRSAQRDGGQPTITLHAPRAGVVTSLDVRDGEQVTAGQTLMTLNGLSSVWVEAALPQALAGRVRAGTPVTVHVDALPGQTFHGSVEALLPDIDTATRTQGVRIVLDNADGSLTPGMFATVQLNPAQGDAVPVVPDDAVIASGSRTRVILAEGDGRFRAVPVRVGRAADGYTAILDGLKGGETIVVSGQFLIDSEASLSGALERLGGLGTGAQGSGTGRAASSSQPAMAASAPMPGMTMGDKP